MGKENKRKGGQMTFPSGYKLDPLVRYPCPQQHKADLHQWPWHLQTAARPGLPCSSRSTDGHNWQNPRTCVGDIDKWPRDCQGNRCRADPASEICPTETDTLPFGLNHCHWRCRVRSTAVVFYRLIGGVWGRDRNVCFPWGSKFKYSEF